MMRKILFFIIFFTLALNSQAKIQIKKIKNKNIELIKFQSPDRKFPGKDNVIAQIHFPKERKKKIPVIIFQHGSSRDGMKFKKWGGKTDEMGKRIAKEELKKAMQ